eukprot:3301298-Ditylum_brightwellii.AAC.1
MGTTKEWLKFQQKLEAVITKQSITSAQVPTAIDDAEQINGPQSKPNYEETIKDINEHMFNTY